MYVLGECGIMGVIKSVKVITTNLIVKQAEIKDTKDKLSDMALKEAGK